MRANRGVDGREGGDVEDFGTGGDWQMQVVLDPSCDPKRKT